MKLSRWSSLEVLVLVQCLLNGVLLFPGTQPLRFAIRAVPYALSLALFFCAMPRKRKIPLPPGAFWMQLALLLLVLALLHPATQARAGIAQLIFQLAIVCPVFWAARQLTDEQRLMRVLRLVFLCSALGAAVGLLQIYYPARFLPAAFSAEASESWLRSVTFVGPNGSVLVRPPGLSDLPGGAAVAGSLAAILGLAFSSLRKTRLWVRCVCLMGALVGISVLYLTQVRSLAIMTVVSILLLGAFSLRQPRIWNRGWLALAGIFLVIGSFVYAVTVGGEAVRSRFLGLTREGLVNSYQANRGWNWHYTFHEALEKYPLGAGLGRWGMMSVHFADPNRLDSPPLWAEIQLTGWLFDGGVPLWILYGAGLLVSMLFVYRIASSSRYGETVPFAAALIFAINSNIIGASLSGPAFNTTMGMQYWMLIAALYGTARASWRGPSLRQVRFDFLARPAAAPVVR